MNRSRRNFDDDDDDDDGEDGEDEDVVVDVVPLVNKNELASGDGGWCWCCWWLCCEFELI